MTYDADADGDPRDFEAAERRKQELLEKRKAAREPKPVWLLASQYKPRPVTYLWDKFIPRGELVLVEGKKKGGKSTAIATVVAGITTGARMPDGTAGVGPAHVVWITGEESADNVVMRLEDARADMERVSIINPESDGIAAKDAEDVILDRVVETGAVLVVIDPIKAFMRGDDSDEIGVRQQLTAFVRIAHQTGTTVLGVRHWRKGLGAADERGAGSIAYGATARATLGVAVDEDGRRALFVIEASNVRPGHAMTFVLEGEEEGRPPRLQWGERCMVDPDSFALADLTARKQEKPREEAGDAIEEVLADGPMPREDALRQIKAACPGASERTIKRAAADLGVITRRQGFGKPALWALPQSGHADPPGGGGIGPTGQNGRNGPNSAVSTVGPGSDGGTTAQNAADGQTNEVLPFGPPAQPPRRNRGPTVFRGIPGIPDGTTNIEARGHRWAAMPSETLLDIDTCRTLHQRGLLPVGAPT